MLQNSLIYKEPKYSNRLSSYLSSFSYSSSPFWIKEENEDEYEDENKEENKNDNFQTRARETGRQEARTGFPIA